MSATREEVRVELGSRLATTLEVPGLAQKVYAYVEADFGSQTPVVMIATAGTGMQPLTHQGSRMIHLYDLHVYVLYALEDGTWTAEQSQQRLDQIYSAIATWLDVPTNKVTNYWKSIKQITDSVVIPESVGGLGYWHEVIPLRVEVY